MADCIARGETRDVFSCGICLTEPPQRAQICIHCSFLFCHACIKSWFARPDDGSKKCPNCLTVLGHFELRPALFTGRLLDVVQATYARAANTAASLTLAASALEHATAFQAESCSSGTNIALKLASIDKMSMSMCMNAFAGLGTGPPTIESVTALNARLAEIGMNLPLLKANAVSPSLNDLKSKVDAATEHARRVLAESAAAAAKARTPIVIPDTPRPRKEMPAAKSNSTSPTASLSGRSANAPSQASSSGAQEAVSAPVTVGAAATAPKPQPSSQPSSQPSAKHVAEARLSSEAQQLQPVQGSCVAQSSSLSGMPRESAKKTKAALAVNVPTAQGPAAACSVPAAVAASKPAVESPKPATASPKPAAAAATSKPAAAASKPASAASAVPSPAPLPTPAPAPTPSSSLAPAPARSPPSAPAPNGAPPSSISDAARKAAAAAAAAAATAEAAAAAELAAKRSVSAARQAAKRKKGGADSLAATQAVAKAEAICEAAVTEAANARTIAEILAIDAADLAEKDARAAAVAAAAEANARAVAQTKAEDEAKKATEAAEEQTKQAEAARTAKEQAAEERRLKREAAALAREQARAAQSAADKAKAAEAKRLKEEAKKQKEEAAERLKAKQEALAARKEEAEAKRKEKEALAAAAAAAAAEKAKAEKAKAEKAKAEKAKAEKAKAEKAKAEKAEAQKVAAAEAKYKAKKPGATPRLSPRRIGKLGASNEDEYLVEWSKEYPAPHNTLGQTDSCYDLEVPFILRAKYNGIYFKPRYDKIIDLTAKRIFEQDDSDELRFELSSSLYATHASLKDPLELCVIPHFIDPMLNPFARIDLPAVHDWGYDKGILRVAEALIKFGKKKEKEAELLASQGKSPPHPRPPMLSSPERIANPVLKSQFSATDLFEYMELSLDMGGLIAVEKNPKFSPFAREALAHVMDEVGSSFGRQVLLAMVNTVRKRRPLCLTLCNPKIAPPLAKPKHSVLSVPLKLPLGEIVGDDMQFCSSTVALRYVSPASLLNFVSPKPSPSHLSLESECYFQSARIQATPENLPLAMAASGGQHSCYLGPPSWENSNMRKCANPWGGIISARIASPPRPESLPIGVDNRPTPYTSWGEPVIRALALRNAYARCDLEYETALGFERELRPLENPPSITEVRKQVLGTNALSTILKNSMHLARPAPAHVPYHVSAIVSAAKEQFFTALKRCDYLAARVACDAGIVGMAFLSYPAIDNTLIPEAVASENKRMNDWYDTPLKDRAQADENGEVPREPLIGEFAKSEAAQGSHGKNRTDNALTGILSDPARALFVQASVDIEVRRIISLVVPPDAYTLPPLVPLHQMTIPVLPRMRNTEYVSGRIVARCFSDDCEIQPVDSEHIQLAHCSPAGLYFFHRAASFSLQQTIAKPFGVRPIDFTGAFAPAVKGPMGMPLAGAIDPGPGIVELDSAIVRLLEANTAHGAQTVLDAHAEAAARLYRAGITCSIEEGLSLVIAAITSATELVLRGGFMRPAKAPQVPPEDPSSLHTFLNDEKRSGYSALGAFRSDVDIGDLHKAEARAWPQQLWHTAMEWTCLAELPERFSAGRTKNGTQLYFPNFVGTDYVGLDWGLPLLPYVARAVREEHHKQVLIETLAFIDRTPPLAHDVNQPVTAATTVKALGATYRGYVNLIEQVAMQVAMTSPALDSLQPSLPCPQPMTRLLPVDRSSLVSLAVSVVLSHDDIVLLNSFEHPWHPCRRLARSWRAAHAPDDAVKQGFIPKKKPTLKELIESPLTPSDFFFPMTLDEDRIETVFAPVLSSVAAPMSSGGGFWGHSVATYTFYSCSQTQQLNQEVKLILAPYHARSFRHFVDPHIVCVAHFEVDSRSSFLTWTKL